MSASKVHTSDDAPDMKVRIIVAIGGIVFGLLVALKVITGTYDRS
jgi:hypothetical protein